MKNQKATRVPSPMMNIKDPAEARLLIRFAKYCGHTAGIAPDFIQGNVCILPQAYALDFATFCQRNSQACPLIAIGEVGDPLLHMLGDIDIRTDVPKYRVFRDGNVTDEPNDITDIWRDDFVTFVLGCSFSFEQTLLEAGIVMQHIEHNTTVPIYRTSIDCISAGVFSSKMVVSMRPMTPLNAINAIHISSRFPDAHGAPVHIGLPEQIGITDIMQPDFGDPPVMADDELPVFWACGVTSQVALEEVKPSICITYSPACMLITDKKR